MTATENRFLLDAADRDAIRNLVAAYCDAVWLCDIERIVALFTEDGAFVMTGAKIGSDGNRQASSDSTTAQAVKGNAALRELYARAVSAQQPLPICHQHVIELGDPGQAKGHCVCELRDGRSLDWIGYVRYDDDYVKIGDQWKFQRRSPNVRLR